jgi:hypothetical protein
MSKSTVFFPLFLKNMQTPELQTATVEDTKIETVLFHGSADQSVFAIEEGSIELRDEDDPHGTIILVSSDGDRGWVYSNVLLDHQVIDALADGNSVDVGAGQRLGIVADGSPGLVLAIEGEESIAGETFEIPAPQNPIPTLRSLNAQPLPGDQPGSGSAKTPATDKNGNPVTASRQQNTDIQKADADAKAAATVQQNTEASKSKAANTTKNVLIVAGLGVGLYVTWKLLKA